MQIDATEDLLRLRLESVQKNTFIATAVFHMFLTLIAIPTTVPLRSATPTRRSFPWRIVGCNHLLVRSLLRVPPRCCHVRDARWRMPCAPRAVALHGLEIVIVSRRQVSALWGSNLWSGLKFHLAGPRGPGPSFVPPDYPITQYATDPKLGECSLCFA